MRQLLSIHVIERFQMTDNIYAWELKGAETKSFYFLLVLLAPLKQSDDEGSMAP
jgi:hypothetical protein